MLKLFYQVFKRIACTVASFTERHARRGECLSGLYNFESSPIFLRNIYKASLLSKMNAG